MTKEIKVDKELSASEALYGFMGWLTTRDEVVTFSCRHNASKSVDLVREFSDSNSLKEPRDGWEKNLVHPKDKEDAK